jgi:hypothetical protein
MRQMDTPHEDTVTDQDVTPGSRARALARVRILYDPETETVVPMLRLPVKGELIEDGRAQYEVRSVIHHIGVHDDIGATIYVNVVKPLRDTP